MGWIVHKFGGTSVRDAERYENAAKLVLAEAQDRRSAVVVSAMGGLTDALLALVDTARRREDYGEALAAIRERVVGTAEQLSCGLAATDFERELSDIEDLLRAVTLLGTTPDNARDLVSGYGEVWSARTLAAYLSSRGTPASVLDARNVLVVEPADLAPVVRWEESKERLGEFLAKHTESITIVTGFVARDPDGIMTTLGRNGSDYTASIFGSLLDAETIQIWTDVDGVLSADPRRVPGAVVLDRISYEEAMELAHFGAKVLHPATMTPAIAKQIPIRIRNAMAPEVEGSVIHTETGGGSVKGFATIDDMALVNVEGTSMIGVPGIAHRLFGALREERVSVLMISQGSSEHSICFAVPQDSADTAKRAVERAFHLELQHGMIERVDVELGCTVLAAVGEGMTGKKGVAASLFGALRNAGVNVRAIAQGSSERNISVVVDGKDSARALRAVHAGFYLSPHTISIGLIGPGVVGGTLLEQLRDEVERLRAESNIDLRVRGIASTSKMLLSDDPIDLATWRDAFGGGQPTDLDAFVAHIRTDAVPNAAIIDCSSSDELAGHYADWVQAGLHVITPNKKLGSGDLDRFRALREATKKHNRHFLYETTVGAGLPILKTLEDLIATGDRVDRIEGILSGTLAYLFNRYDGKTPFSEIVRDAKAKGYTEPDPRDDLSGMDVARKLVILGREMGLELSLDAVEVESLVPSELEDVSIDEFLDRLTSIDDRMQARFEAAAKEGKVLRFVASLTSEGAAKVKLDAYDRAHPFAGIRLTDNIVQLETKRYDENPLVVQGPGAGPDVTAGGAFADLLRLASYLGAMS